MTTNKNFNSYSNSDSSSSSSRVKTSILRNTSSIYKKLGLNFKPQKRRRPSLTSDDMKNEIYANFSSPSVDEKNRAENVAILHEPVYSQVTPRHKARQAAAAVFPICIGLSPFFGTSTELAEGEFIIPGDENNAATVGRQEHPRRFVAQDDDDVSEIYTVYPTTLEVLTSRTTSPDSGIISRTVRSPNESPSTDQDENCEVTFRTSPTCRPEITSRDSGVTMTTTPEQHTPANQKKTTAAKSPYLARTSLNTTSDTENPAPQQTPTSNNGVKHLQYDSETLRKNAQRNRETAAKLLPKLNTKQQNRHKDNNGTCKSNTSDYGKNRRETQTSSNSGSDGSSTGTADFLSTTTASTTDGGIRDYHDQQRQQLVWRSPSNDNVNLYDIYSYSPPVNDSSSMTSSVTALLRRPSSTATGVDQRSQRQLGQIMQQRRLLLEFNNGICAKDIVQNSNIIRRNSVAHSTTTIENDDEKLNPAFYAVVQKREKLLPPVPAKGTVAHSNGKMNPPPPLPRKPPPSLDDEQTGAEYSSPSTSPSSLSSASCGETDSFHDSMNHRHTANVVYVEDQIYLHNHNDDLSSSAVSLADDYPTNNNDVISCSDSSKCVEMQRQHFPLTTVENQQNFVANGGDSSPQIFATPKRPIVPVHPYKEKSVAHGNRNNDLAPLNNDGVIFGNKSSPHADQQQCSNEYGGTVVASYLWIDRDPHHRHGTSSAGRPPVPPKPERSVVSIKVPPRLPPKPASFALKKRSDSNTNMSGESESKCRRAAVVSPDGADDNFAKKDLPRLPITVENCDAQDAGGLLQLQQNRSIDISSPGRRSVDFISIVYDCSLKRGDAKNRRFAYAEDAKNSNGYGECFSGDISATLEAVENEKKLLLSKLNSKLIVLKKAYREIEQEIRYNDNVGHRLEALVEKSDCLSVYDKQKYRLHVEDTEKLAHLFLKLSTQLARVENDLDRMPPTSSPKEKHRFTERRQRLLSQLTDAKNLKDDLDRRCESISVMLKDVFNEEQISEYENFIQMKTLLLVDAREIEENIALLEERQKFLEQNVSANSTTASYQI